MTISMDKQYRTRSGREVRIYAVDGIKEFPIHGAINNENGWLLASWNKGGTFTDGHAHDYDLIEVKPRIRREYWVNVYQNNIIGGGLHDTKWKADDAAMQHRIACAKVVIDCEEGEGL